MYKTLKVIELCNSHSAYLSPLQRKYKKIKRGNKELLHMKNTEFKVPILSKNSGLHRTITLYWILCDMQNVIYL